MFQVHALSSLIVALLCIFSFLLVWQFAGYPLLMGIFALRAKLKIQDYDFRPFVSILVPTYNEAAVIEKKLANLLELDYPSDLCEIIVIDSGSTDGTADAVRKVLKERGARMPDCDVLRPPQIVEQDRSFLSLSYRKVAHRRAIRQPRRLVRLAFLSPLSFRMSHGNKGSTYNAIVVESCAEATPCLIILLRRSKPRNAVRRSTLRGGALQQVVGFPLGI